MTPPAPPVRDQPAAAAFLVERYVSRAAAASLAASVVRLARLCTASGHSEVRYLQSTYLPADETCFCLFLASSAEAVTAVNHRAGFALHRITVADILLAHSETPDPRREP